MLAELAPHHPRLVLAASAEVSGHARTPAGQRALAYTFGPDWVGGPQIGYVRTEHLVAHVPRSYGSDLRSSIGRRQGCADQRSGRHEAILSTERELLSWFVTKARRPSLDTAT